MTEYRTLYRWYDSDRNDYLTTADPDWAGDVGDHRTPNYEFVRAEGFVFNPDNGQPSGTVPLHSWYDPDGADNFTTTHPDWAGEPGDTREPNYRYVRLEGYIYDPLAPPPPGCLALYGWYSPDAQDSHATSDRRWGGTSACPDRTDKWLSTSRYRFVRREGYLIPPTIGFPDQYINVPVFFHFVHDSTDSATGLPAHTTEVNQRTETMVDFDRALEALNSMVSDAAGMDARKLRFVRVGVRYFDVNSATWENPWGEIDKTIGDHRLYGAVNRVATRHGGFTNGSWKCHADANALPHELGHTLGLFHFYQGNKQPDTVELLWRDMDAESPTSCYVRGDGVCDTPPDYGFADENENLHMVDCRELPEDDTHVAVPCVQEGPPCDLSDPIIDGRGVCSTTADGDTVRTYDPLRLGLQEGKPVNVMSYAKSDEHFFTYEQFLRMHAYAQWRRGRVDSVPDDDLWTMRKLEVGPEGMLRDIMPSREDTALSYVRQVLPSFRYDPVLLLGVQPLTEDFYVTPSIGDVALVSWRVRC